MIKSEQIVLVKNLLQSLQRQMKTALQNAPKGANGNHFRREFRMNAQYIGSEHDDPDYTDGRSELRAFKKSALSRFRKLMKDVGAKPRDELDTMSDAKSFVFKTGAGQCVMSYSCTGDKVTYLYIRFENEALGDALFDVAPEPLGYQFSAALNVEHNANAWYQLRVRMMCWRMP